jgi:hypothetical protein
MKNQRQSAEQPRFLSGWKEIANYLGKGVRTVQRYERALGLPVRRPAGTTTGSVVATKAELDAWVAASPIREAFRLTRTETETGTASRMAASIKTGIQEMTRLREQMMSLRSDVRASVQVLWESLNGLQGDLNSKRFSQPTRSLTLLQATERSGQMLELLDSYSKQKTS